MWRNVCMHTSMYLYVYMCKDTYQRNVSIYTLHHYTHKHNIHHINTLIHCYPHLNIYFHLTVSEEYMITGK